MKKIVISFLLLLAIAGVAVAVFMPKASPAKPVSPHGQKSVVNLEEVLPASHPPAIPADTNLANSGKVLEVINSSGYTYTQVRTGKETLWLAAYKTDVAKGATVRYSSGIVMQKFYSKSLDRTFDQILFVDALEQVKK